MPKEGSHCLCLWVILMGPVFKMGKNCYAQVFLKECNYIVKEKKMNKFINTQQKFLLKNLIRRLFMENNSRANIIIVFFKEKILITDAWMAAKQNIFGVF